MFLGTLTCITSFTIHKTVWSWPCYFVLLMITLINLSWLEDSKLVFKLSSNLCIKLCWVKIQKLIKRPFTAMTFFFLILEKADLLGVQQLIGRLNNSSLWFLKRSLLALKWTSPSWHHELYQPIIILPDYLKRVIVINVGQIL